MRKIVIIAVVALFTVVLIGASAHAWKGKGAGYGCLCYSVDPAKTQKFYSDTLPLRQKMLQLRGELSQLFVQPNPDWNAITKKKQEMVQLKTEMQRKAQEYGLPYGGIMRMQRFGRGW